MSLHSVVLSRLALLQLLDPFVGILLAPLCDYLTTFGNGNRRHPEALQIFTDENGVFHNFFWVKDIIHIHIEEQEHSCCWEVLFKVNGVAAKHELGI